MSDPYENHLLRDEWEAFKYYTEGVTTARMQHIEPDGTRIPCVKVFMRDTATEEQVENVYEKANNLGLSRYEQEFEESDEHVFIPQESSI